MKQYLSFSSFLHHKLILKNAMKKILSYQIITSLNSCIFLCVNIANTLEPHLWAFLLVEAFFSAGVWTGAGAGAGADSDGSSAGGASGWGSAGAADSDGASEGASSAWGASSDSWADFFLLFFFFSFFSSSP